MSAIKEKGGGTFQGIKLLLCHRQTYFLVDEAFIGMAGHSVAHLVPEHPNPLVTRTLSKAHSLAGFRVGYGIFPEAVADDLNRCNDAYPLARPSQAAAIATLQNEEQIYARAVRPLLPSSYAIETSSLNRSTTRNSAPVICASPRRCPRTTAVL